MGQGQTFPIVGIGASAGGLEAVQDLVSAMPADAGLCLVVIQHLAPDHPSIMDQLLAARSKMPVKKIEDGVKAAPNVVFVIPAGPSVTIENDRFHLHPRQDTNTLRTPIDEFLVSLAEERGRNAYSVILSGTGTDGSAGVRAVKAAGGFAFAQLSDSAKFPGMPDSAIATGLVDLVLPPREIAGRLVDIVHHRAQLQSGDRHGDRKGAIQERLADFIGLLNDDGHDFSQYKHGTLIRRIERRMSLLRLSTVDGFLERLAENAEERSLLRQDFLIGVTKFFRDDEAFSVLAKKVITPLLDSDRQRFRIWVPACSTGEEAYSIAMLMKEAMDEREDQRPFQVFGTDIDKAALSGARSGYYAQSTVEDLSEARRQAFFQKVDGRFQVSPILREACVFAPHNLLTDSPFSRLDIISCRNLMIYLNADVQHEVIPKLHYALNPSGHLMLGPSESIGGSERFFTPVDREHRIFRRNDDEARKFSALSMADQLRSASFASAVTVSHNKTDIGQPEPDFETKVSNYVLRERAPPYAVINGQDEVVYVSERMGSFVRPAMGILSASLDQLLARELRLPLTSAVMAAREQGEAVTTPNIVVHEDGEKRLIDLHAEPLPFEDNQVLVTLEPVRTQDAAALVDSARMRSESEQELVHRELALTRKQLRKTEAEFDATEQELKSSNEELLSMNEELQSSNEELETSREELQSINEELETINAELSENNRQLVEVNSDLQNLFESTEIATIFLDQNLCVRRYTPTSRRLFGLQDRDLGRPIRDLAWAVVYDDLEEDAAHVAQSLQPIEREVRVRKTEDTFLMRIRPYRRTDDRIDGCVITFLDITARKRYEKQIEKNAELLERQYSELEHLYDTTPVGLNLLDRELRYIRINERLAEINGIPVEDHIGKRQEELVPNVDPKIRNTQLRVLETGEPSFGNQVRASTPAEPGEERDFIVDYYPVWKNGEVFAVGCCVQEVTEQVELQKKIELSHAALQESETRLAAAMKAGGVGVHDYDPQTELATWTDEIYDLWGYERGSEITYERWAAQVHPDDLEATAQAVAASLEPDGDRYYLKEYRVINAKTGEVRWVRANGDVLFDGEQPVRLIGTIIDITEKIQAMEHQQLLLSELQHRVKNTLSTILAVVQFSAKNAADVAAFTGSLRRRIQALSRTHDLLTAEDWSAGSLHEVVAEELRAYGGDERDRFEFHGEDAKLSPKQMLSLALAFHELATNAAKYGALATDEGRIVLRSVQDDDGTLNISWRELGGPPVEKPDPEKVGFGKFLIERVLSTDLGGQVETAFEPDGFRCSISFPLYMDGSSGG